MMLPSLTKIGILIDFKINQDFIAEVLCIKKDKPKSTCNGKCYLSEQLKKAEDQEEKQAPTTKKEKSQVLYCSKKSFTPLKHADTYLSKLNSSYKNEFNSSSFVADIFRPPKRNLI